jgi:GNAT superfamily N-acetyltransferase
MIELKTLNRRELEDFINSNQYEKYDFLPISKPRGLSQTKNPVLTDDDILLILAFDGEKLAGYLGCFPTISRLEDKEYKHAWLSTLYINENFRGKKIAQQLLQKAFDVYQDQISITEFTIEAEGLYNKTGQFRYIVPKKGKRYYFKSDLQHLLPSKNPKYKKFEGLFSVVDSISNPIISIGKKSPQKPNFRFKILEKVDNESEEFIKKFNSNRNKTEINWIIENPWLLESNKKEERYLFSLYAKEFRYFWIKIYNENNDLESCGLLLLRDGHLKIPYLFSGLNPTKWVEFLGYFVKEYNIKRLTSYQTAINNEIANNKKLGHIYERDFERRYLFHKNLAPNLPSKYDPQFQDGDGDPVTT